MKEFQNFYFFKFGYPLGWSVNKHSNHHSLIFLHNSLDKSLNCYLWKFGDNPWIFSGSKTLIKSTNFGQSQGAGSHIHGQSPLTRGDKRDPPWMSSGLSVIMTNPKESRWIRDATPLFRFVKKACTVKSLRARSASSGLRVRCSVRPVRLGLGLCNWIRPIWTRSSTDMKSEALV